MIQEPSAFLPRKNFTAGVEDVAPVVGALHEGGVVFLLAEGFCDLGDAEVAVGGVDGFGGGLLDAVGGEVVELEIVFDADAAVALCQDCPAWWRASSGPR